MSRIRITQSLLGGGTRCALLLSLICLQCWPFAQERAEARQLSIKGPIHERPTDIPHAWKELIGEYTLDSDTVCILEQDGALQFKDSRGLYRLRVEGEDRFTISPSWQSGDTVCVFRRNAAGLTVSFAAQTSTFKRIFFGGESGASFRITPLKSVDLLRREARQASPPKEEGNFLKPDLVELKLLDSTIHLDVRYATTNNFLGEQFYSQARAFLQRPAAEGLVRVHQSLRELGYGVLIHDAYRPWYVTKMFWDATPQEHKDFVADPAKGSRHNRGCAVDLSLYYLKTGEAVEMASGYDEFSHRAYPSYPGGTSLQRWHRQLLRRVMEEQGFRVFEVEWWHFDYRDWRNYPIGTLTFEEIQ
jgi:D-alanyl-D-alanine dipeptidase